MAAEIDVHALRKITDAILNHVIQDLGIEKITITEDRDFYWEVPQGRVHAVRQDQPQLDVGRLSDDWEFVENLIKEGEPKIALMLVHIAPLLRMIGENIGR